jgi:hypothetical protein
METTTARQQRPAIRYRDMVKGMNNDEKIELMFVLIESMRSSMSADSESEPPLMPPYSEEEIYARIAQSKRDSAAGLGQESEEMFRELEKEFAKEDYELENSLCD